jgi:hypothetical protein
MTTSVIYTAICGEKDRLLDIRQKLDTTKAVAFVDDLLNPIYQNRGWELRKAVRFSDDPGYSDRRNAKIHKILPHLFFPEAEYSLWVDATHFPADYLQVIIDNNLQTNDIACFDHPLRNCLYDEGQEILRINRETGRGDHAFLVEAQMKYYEKLNYGKNLGLVSNTVILRRHTEQITKLNLAWWEQICKFSSRDQLSFMFVANKLGIQVGIMPGDWLKNDSIPCRQRHLKEL